MTSDIKKALKKVDTKDWKKVSVEFGPHSLEVTLPPNCVELTMKEVPVLSDPQKAIEDAFLHPISSPPLEEIIRKKAKPAGEMTVAIAVSDITRPVPYKGESGILPPLLKRL
jgi:nickel-dependent lactate racemase